MNNSDLKNSNNTYLAKWLQKEISDEEAKKHLSEKDFLAYKKIEKGMEYFVAPVFDNDKFFHQISRQTSKRKTNIFSLKWYSIAATIIFLLVLGYFFNASLPLHYQSDFGERKTVVLNDGSEAILNARSFIQSPKKWKDKRELNLRGEAFFKVKKGKSFSVNTINGIVTVLGTQFQINSQPNFFLVKCFEGKVRVVQNRDTIYLTKGKAFQKNYDKTSHWNFNKDKPTWLQGESSFKSTPLNVVIRSLENQFDIKIVPGKIDTSQIFTGSFEHQDLNLALKSVLLPMGIAYKLENKKVFLTKK